LITSFLSIILATGLYGLVHSLLASLKAKEMAAVWLGAGFKWYRLAYNIFATISLLPVLALAIIMPDKPIYDIPSPWNALLILLQLVGAGISCIAAFQTGIGYLSGLKQLMETSTSGSPVVNRLETGGLYQYVRHPIYSGAILFLWTSSQLTWNSLALKLALTLYFILGAMVEEKKLVAEFGDTYRAYRLHTPMLIPGLKKPVQ
jgi:methanethiol S-methyltransferase